MIPNKLVGGRYLVLDGLGTGPLGPVWRAQDRLTGGTVVVKELRLPGTPDPAAHTRFRAQLLREARTVGRLRDPGLVRVHDVLVAEGTDLLVTEYLPGTRLSEHVAAGGPLSVEDMHAVARALLFTLRGAHRTGLVHGLLRPHSILLGDDDRVVLLDIGLAPAVEPFGGLPAPDDGYTAPERLAGGPPTPPADLWAVGTLLTDVAEPEPGLADLAARLHNPDPGLRPSAIEALALLGDEPERRRTWFGFRRA